MATLVKTAKNSGFIVVHAGSSEQKDERQPQYRNGLFTSVSPLRVRTTCSSRAPSDWSARLRRQCTCTTMHCMEDQITFRLPRDVARVLARRARERGVPKSQVVREAVATYLTAPPAGPGPIDTRQRIAPFLGAVTLDAAAMERDALAQRIRQHNWRE